MTPEQEARNALNTGVPREDLSPAAQAEYDRLKEEGPPLEDIRYWMRRFLNQGDIGSMSSAEACCGWLQARHPEEAVTDAAVYETQRVGQKCDLEHLPTTIMSPEERRAANDWVDRCEILLRWMAKAGTPEPKPVTCIHGQTF